MLGWIFWFRFYGGRKGKISPALEEAFGEGEKKKKFLARARNRASLAMEKKKAIRKR
jgi:hypothetical protein